MGVVSKGRSADPCEDVPLKVRSHRTAIDLNSGLSA